jgi:hypothetical protein
LESKLFGLDKPGTHTHTHNLPSHYFPDVTLEEDCGRRLQTL